MTLNLSAKNRAHLFLHNFVSRFGVDGLKPVSIKRVGSAFELSTTGHTLSVPAALIWRSYRRGWDARVKRLSAEFALNAPFSVGMNDTVIDIGANVGDFSIAAAQLGAKVYGFDGDPDVIECNLSNTASFPSIVSECAILWSEETEVKFYSSPGRADSSIFLPPDENALAFTAMATTLDQLADKHQIGEVTLLKMDAEGAEPEVLDGGSETLARTRHVAIDTGPERLGEETAKPCIERLVKMGFRILPHPDPRRKVTLATRD